MKRKVIEVIDLTGSNEETGNKSRQNSTEKNASNVTNKMSIDSILNSNNQNESFKTPYLSKNIHSNITDFNSLGASETGYTSNSKSSNAIFPKETGEENPALNIDYLFHPNPNFQNTTSPSVNSNAPTKGKRNAKKKVKNVKQTSSTKSKNNGKNVYSTSKNQDKNKKTTSTLTKQKPQHKLNDANKSKFANKKATNPEPQIKLDSIDDMKKLVLALNAQAKAINKSTELLLTNSQQNSNPSSNKTAIDKEFKNLQSCIYKANQSAQNVFKFESQLKWQQLYSDLSNVNSHDKPNEDFSLIGKNYPDTSSDQLD